MEAKLLLEGAKVKIYTLEIDSRNEVLEFLNDHRHPAKRSIITGFIKIIKFMKVGLKAGKKVANLYMKLRKKGKGIELAVLNMKMALNYY